MRFHLILELYPKETFLKMKMCRYKQYKIQRIRVWGGRGGGEAQDYWESQKF